jgi:hypothetical protein
MQDFSMEMAGGDSMSRVNTVFDCFPTNYKYAGFPIWLPFPFLFFSIPLHFHYSVDSLTVFQFLISILTLFYTTKLYLKCFDREVAIMASLFFAIMPVSLFLVNSALSEPTFLLLLVMFLYTYISWPKNTYALILSVIFMCCAAMTRYEGWFLYLFFIGFEFLKNRSYKRVCLVIIPFLLMIYIYESFQIKNGSQLFHGLISNPEESSAVNIKNHMESIFSRLKVMLDIVNRNSGFLLLGAPFYFYERFRMRNLTMYDAFFSLSFLMVFWGGLFNSIAIFERYWLMCLALGLPIFITGLTRIVNSKKIVYSILIFSVLIVNPFAKHTFSSENIIGTREMSQYISKLGITKIYVDDFNQNYYFMGIRMYQHEQERKVRIFRRKTEFNRINNKVERNKKIIRHALGLIKAERIEHVLIINNSDTSLGLKKLKKNKPLIKLNRVKVIGDYNLYSVED